MGQRECAKGLCKVKKIPKIPKKIGSGWVGGSRSHSDKKNWKIVQKQSFASVQFVPKVFCGAATSNQRLVLVDLLSAAITS